MDHMKGEAKISQKQVGLLAPRARILDTVGAEKESDPFKFLFKKISFIAGKWSHVYDSLDGSA